jgi:hypothetical protein
MRSKTLFGRQCTSWAEKAALERRVSESMSDPRMQDRCRVESLDDRNHADAIRKILFESGGDPLKSAA